MKGQSDMDNRPQEQAVKEIDTATINLSAASTGAPVNRRTGKKNTVVAGQIVRLKLALFFLLPLITVSLWTEGSFWLNRWGLRSALLNLPGAWAPVNLRGLLQFFFVAACFICGPAIFCAGVGRFARASAVAGGAVAFEQLLFCCRGTLYYGAAAAGTAV